MHILKTSSMLCATVLLPLCTSACQGTNTIDLDSLRAREARAHAGEASAADLAQGAKQGSAGSGVLPDAKYVATPSPDEAKPDNTWHPVDTNDGQFVGPSCAPIDLCDTGGPAPDAMSLAQSGECVRAVAREQGPLRQVTWLPDGNLFAVTESGELRRYQDWSCDGTFLGEAPEQVSWAQTGGGADNVALDDGNGFLYAGAPGGVVRFKYCSDAPGGGMPERVIDGIPAAHDPTAKNFTTLHIEDEFLYAVSDGERIVKRWQLAAFDAPDRAEPLPWDQGEVVATEACDVDPVIGSAHVTEDREHTRYVAQDGKIFRIAKAPPGVGKL